MGIGYDCEASSLGFPNHQPQSLPRALLSTTPENLFSFLALLLRKELQDRLETQGDKFEWARVLRDLEALQYTEVENDGKRFRLRSDLADTTAAAFRAAGVAIPPSVQKAQE